MTHALARFFDTNQVILYSTYGQVFFILGLAIVLQSRKHSRLPLANSLWYLSAFGFTHGFHEWGYVFIPIQAAYMPKQVVDLLEWAQLFLLVLSFLFLLLFGLDLVLSGPQYRRRRWLIAAGLSFSWLLILTGTVLFSYHAREDVLATGNVVARYLLGIPAALLAAVGVRRQAEQVAERGLLHIARFLRYAAWPLRIYALFGGVIGPHAPFFLAHWLNEDLLLMSVGVPAPVFRSLTGMALAYFIIRALEVFEIETDQLIEEIQRARLLADDRERIGRELHDGTIQSIYAAGLMLEDASLTIQEDPHKAQEKIRYVMRNLNEAIQDIRRYIFDLRDQLSDKPLASQLEGLIENYRGAAPYQINYVVQGKCPYPLSPLLIQHIMRVAGESLRNVHKHAQATKVDIHLTYEKAQLSLVIQDDGVGFNGQPPRMGEGLLNIKERVQLLGGHMLVDGRLNEGVYMGLTVPYQQNRRER